MSEHKILTNVERLEHRRESSRLWRKNHPEKSRESSKNWRRTHPELMKNAMNRCNAERTYFLTYKEKKDKDPYFLLKTRARNFIKRHPELLGLECEFCSSTENLQAHHPDYNYPEIVVTACASCHAFIDKGSD